MKGKRELYLRMLNSWRWRELRNIVKAESPLCEDCRRAGRLGAVEEVHHIIPVESGRDEAEMERLCYDRSNLVGLCRRCHNERHKQAGRCTKEENARRKRAEADAFVARFGTPRKKESEDTPGGLF